MNNDHLISIGMPMYNAEKFVAKAISSILQQTYQNFELIITDDGSTDESMKIVKSFDDPRIIIISDNQNKGISFRLNQQISLAKGKYFVRMDSDDIMFPERLEKQLTYLKNNTDIDVLGTSAVIIDNENQIIGFREAPNIPKNVKNAVKTCMFIHPSVCGKTSWFKKHKYDCNMDGAEDFDLWLRSWKTSKFENIKEPLIFYRDPLEFKIKTYLDRLKKQRRMFKKNPIFNENIILKKEMIFTTYLKGLIAQFFHVIGKDQFLVSRRNTTPNDKLTMYRKFMNH